MTYSLDQLSILSTIANSAGGLSLVFGLVTIGVILVRRKLLLRKSINRMAFAIIISDCVASLGFSLGTSTYQDPSAWPGACALQASLLQFGNISTICWNFFMALQCVHVLLLDLSLDQTRPLEKYYHLVAWSTAVAVSLGLLYFASDVYGVGLWWYAKCRRRKSCSGREMVVSMNSGEEMQEWPNITQAVNMKLWPADQWCWISANYTLYRLYFYYIPLWAVFLFNVAVYSLILRALLKYNTEIQQCCGLEDGTVNDTGGCGQENGAERARATRTGRASGRAGRADNNGNGDINSVTRQFAVRSMLYTLAFLMAWLPATINRVYLAIRPSYPLFVLSCVHTFCTSMMGFINCAVFHLTTYKTPSPTRPRASLAAKGVRPSAAAVRPKFTAQAPPKPIVLSGICSEGSDGVEARSGSEVAGQKPGPVTTQR
ncbi:uncharacterized protein BJ171DRAFT_609997 [Polychytrium aggregatum]|uniref:uncharacterized protein n=1 Tax=Polychytrium aggregatum TaxID=110093 RepID=UPI0022FE4320|nr:uncharacterized protein BJ171DRAFT_609997 [Polychytrium aggregatum]KAI9206755.1 hypothetical protein BJ171DRAFT_609997 [Polychytrium aggregatum]